MWSPVTSLYCRDIPIALCFQVSVKEDSVTNGMKDENYLYCMVWDGKTDTTMSKGKAHLICLICTIITVQYIYIYIKAYLFSVGLFASGWFSLSAVLSQQAPGSSYIFIPQTWEQYWSSHLTLTLHYSFKTYVNVFCCCLFIWPRTDIKEPTEIHSEAINSHHTAQTDTSYTSPDISYLFL